MIPVHAIVITLMPSSFVPQVTMTAGTGERRVLDGILILDIEKPLSLFKKLYVYYIIVVFDVFGIIHNFEFFCLIKTLKMSAETVIRLTIKLKRYIIYYIIPAVCCEWAELFYRFL